MSEINKILTEEKSEKEVSDFNCKSQYEKLELIPSYIVEDENKLLEIESKVCSYGDTVHYAENPKYFTRCSGSYLYDTGCVCRSRTHARVG